jgi:hypothetical protein
MGTVEDLMTHVMVKYFNRPDLVFKFKPLSELDPLRRSQADDIDIKNGVKSIDQVLIERNMEPIGMGNCVISPTGVIMLQPFIDGKVTGVPTIDNPVPAEGTDAMKPGQHPDQGGEAPKGSQANEGTNKPKKTKQDVETAKKFAKFAQLMGTSGGEL